LKAATALLFVLLGLVLIGDPASALAAECTNTWLGPEVGEWQIAEYWSAGHVPISSDVTCIPAGKTVEIASGINWSEALQGEGQLDISAGSLGLLGTLEASNIGTLHLSAGVLTGEAELIVLKSLVAAGGTMEGAGRTTVGAEATALIEASEGGGPGLIVKGKRALKSNGSATVSGPAGKLVIKEAALLENFGTLALEAAEGGLIAAEKAEIRNPGSLTLAGTEGQITAEGTAIENSGTFAIKAVGGRLWAKEASLVNSGTVEVDAEGEGNGLVAGGEAVSSLTNTGTFIKAIGSGVTSIGFSLHNEGVVEAEAGALEFTGAITGGKETPGSWNAKGAESRLVFVGDTVGLGEHAVLAGQIELLGAVLVAKEVKGEKATLEAIEGSTLQFYPLPAARAELGEVAIVESTLTVTPEAVVQALHGSRLDKGTITLDENAEAFLTGLEQLSGTTSVAAGAELLGPAMELHEGEIAIAEGGTFGASGTQYGGAVNAAGNSTVFSSAWLLEGGQLATGKHSNVFCEALVQSGGLVSLGSESTVSIPVGIFEGLHSGSPVFLIGPNSAVALGEFIMEKGSAESESETPSVNIGSGTAIEVGEELWVGTGLLTMESGVNLRVGEVSFIGESGAPPPTFVIPTGGSAYFEEKLFFESGLTSIAAGASIDVAGYAFVGEPTGQPTLITGNGTLSVGELDFAGGTMAGGGVTTVRERGVTRVNIPSESHPTVLGRHLKLEGTYELLEAGTLFMSSGATIENHGEFNASGETSFYGAAVQVAEGSTSTPHLRNYGTFEKYTGEGTTWVDVPFENYGTIGERSGELLIGEPSAIPSSEHVEPYGNESSCGDPVNCATGDFSETQVDVAVAGRGVGLDLTRSYSAQEAAAAPAPGLFGYGWSNLFDDRLEVEEAGNRITVMRGDGSTIAFTKNAEGTFEAAVSPQAKLSGNAETGYTLTLPDQTRYGFAGSGRLTSVTDPNGNETTLSYGESGRLKAITDPAGREISLAYNAEGMVESAKDPMGHTVKYGYEGKELANVTMPGETSPRWQFKYDASHRMTTMINGRGGETKNEYDEANRIISQTDPAGRTLDFAYGGFHTKITDKATGAVTDEWFTSYHEPFEITYGYGTADATTSTFTYNDKGAITSSTDGNGHATEYGYDSEGNRTSKLDAAGEETTWTYNPAHEILTETTPKGETTTIERDAAGNPKTISRPAPGEATQTTSFTYDAHGQPETMTDPLGHVWKYEYDAEGDLVGETDPEGDKRTSAYNEDSQLASTVSPKGNEEGAEAAKYRTGYKRDAQGRLTQITDPLGHATEYAYDANGNLEKETDANGHTTTFTYNADDQPTKAKRPDGSVLETEYDGAGQVKAQIDGLGRKTEYVRDVLEEPVEVIDPLGRRTSEKYDGAGNVISKTDRSKRTTTYKYDVVNRLTETSYSDGKTPTAKFSYDKDGNLLAMSDGTGETSYEYDQLDRLVHVKDGHGDAVSYEYNLAGQQTAITYPNGKAVSQGFDKAGRLKNVADWLGNTTTFAYDRNSNLTATTFPSGTSDLDEYGYDRANRMAEVKMKKGSETLASLAYARDKIGQVESFTAKGLPGSESEALGYDANNRLTTAGAESFEYDAADNLTKAPGSTNTYDKANQLEKGTGTAFTYDEEGERTKITPAAGAAPISNFAFGNESTGSGHLAAPAGVAVDSGANVWVADTAHNRIQEFNAKGELIRAFGAIGSGDGELRSPRGLAIDSKGNLWVADAGNNRVQEFNSKGEFVRKFGTEGAGSGQFWGLQDLAIDSAGHIWTLEGGGKLTADNRVQEFSAEGTYLAGFGAAGSENGQFSFAKGIAIDAAGNVWVADTNNNRIQAFKPNGEFIRKFGTEGTGNGQLKAPLGLAFDAEGKLWVADTGNDRMQRFTSEGAYLAQFGTAGPNNGQFSEPQALTVDAGGNLWIADTGNNRVQESSASEFIRQFGGESSGPGNLASPGGLATDSEGDVWVADTSHNRIQEFNGKGEFLRAFGATGTGNGALSEPHAIAVSAAGNVYVADTGNKRVQEFNGKGEFIRKWGSQGEGNGQFYALQGIAIDSEGHVWTIDSGLAGSGVRVQKFSSEGAYLAQFGKQGTENGQFKAPQGIAADAEGHIWVADSGNNRVQEFKPSGEFIRKFGTEGSGNGQFKAPTGIAIDAEGNAWVADTGNDRVQKLSGSGTYLSQFGTPGPNPGQFDAPRGVALDSKGNVWVADTNNNRVQESTATEFLRQLGGESSGPGHLAAPAGVATDSEGNAWVADTAHNRIQEFNSKGGFIRQFGGAGSADGELRSPRGLAVDAKGNVWVADAGNNRVQEFNSKGEFVRKFGTEGSGSGQFRNLADLVIDSEGHIWTLEGGSKLLGNNRVQEFSAEGTYLTGFAAAGSENGQLLAAKGLAVDAKGNLWVADTGNNRVQELKPSGEFIRKFGTEGTGTGQLKGPQDLAFDAEGKLWVADSGNDRFQRFTSEGAYLAQFGTAGPNNGQFAEPQALTIDAKGNFWIADSGNDRVQEWLASTPPTTYSYDQAGNLIGVEREKVGETPAISESYAYDGAGLRASQTVSGATSYPTWNTSAGLPLLLNDGQANYIYGPDGVPIEQISTSGTPTYYHHDQLGSTRMLTSSSGTPTASFTYSAYGAPSARTGTQTTPLGYAGQYTNSESGLQYLRARTYDPVTGQFLSLDPLRAITLSPYGYAENDPLNKSDPSGLSGCGDIMIVSSLCEFGQSTGISNAAAGALNTLTFGQSTKLAGKLFGFNPDCADFGTAGQIGNVIGGGIGFFDGEEEASLASEGADEVNAITSKVRQTRGADGSESVIIKETTPNGKTVQVVHQVGKPLPGGGVVVIHQHPKYGPLPGSETNFPNVP
jgi:RHS repeat-associated protein